MAADSDTWMQSLEAKLEAMRVDVSRTDDGLEAQAGQGITAASARIDPASLFDRLDEVDEAGAERLIAGYASGVKQVLLEPKRSDAAEWDFEESAGRLISTIEVDTFRLGAAAAAGEDPWTAGFFEDLVVAYMIDLDVGMRVLTQAQFDRWAVTTDRVRAAARSMLYHKSRNAKPAPVEEFEGVEELRVGDGFDAMRAIVVRDLFFSEFDDDYRFAIPTQDAFLFVRGDAEDQVDALREAADARYDEADYPLTRSIYGFEVGKPTLVEAR